MKNAKKELSIAWSNLYNNDYKFIVDGIEYVSTGEFLDDKEVKTTGEENNQTSAKRIGGNDKELFIFNILDINFK